METARLVTSVILSSPKDKSSVVIRHWRQAYHAAFWGRKGLKRNRTEKQRQATKFPSLLLLLFIQTQTSLQMSGAPVIHSYVSTRLFCVYLTQLKHSIFIGFCSVFMSFEGWEKLGSNCPGHDYAWPVQEPSLELVNFRPYTGCSTTLSELPLALQSNRTNWKVKWGDFFAE